MLCSLPLFVAAACLSKSLITLLYGPAYAPVTPVLAMLSLFAIPKAVLLPTQMLLMASERQMFLVWWGCLCAALNVILDLVLVGAYGAIGAGVANGIAQ